MKNIVIPLSSSNIEISIIIPAYNEQHRIERTLCSICDFMIENDASFEIIVVNDGSNDNTEVIVNNVASVQKNIRLISYIRNRGKGYAVKAGVQNSRGSYVLFVDADGSSPIQEINKLKSMIDRGKDLVFGSRAISSSDNEVLALIYRKYIGNVFNSLVRLLLLPGVYDTQCGFKLFTKECAADVFSMNLENGFVFDVEILAIAQKRGFKIEEIPINWKNMRGSKVNILLDSLKMLLGLLRIRTRFLFNKYN